MKKILFLAIALIVVAFTFVPVIPVFAQDESPPAETVPDVETPAAPTNPSLPDVAVLISITAFFAVQFGLEKRGTIIAAFVIGLVLWFAPIIADRFPDYKFWIDGFLLYIKWVVSSMGSVDFIRVTGKKIAAVSGKGTASLKAEAQS